MSTISCKKCGHKFSVETWWKPTENNIICAICGTVSDLANFRLGVTGVIEKGAKTLATLSQERDQEFEPIPDDFNPYSSKNKKGD